MRDTYGIHHWRILWSSYSNLVWVRFEPTTTEFPSDALTDWVPLSLRANLVPPIHCHRFVSVRFHFSYCLHMSPRLSLFEVCLRLSHECSRMNDTYGIHHWRILWISYKMLAWVGFEPTTNEFCLDGLTNWAIRPWVELVLRANFVQVFWFHPFFQCEVFFRLLLSSLPTFVFIWSLLEVITWVQRNEWYIWYHSFDTICIIEWYDSLK